MGCGNVGRVMAKLQTPNSKLQHPKKLQLSNSKLNRAFRATLNRGGRHPLLGERAGVGRTATTNSRENALSKRLQFLDPAFGRRPRFRPFVTWKLDLLWMLDVGCWIFWAPSL